MKENEYLAIVLIAVAGLLTGFLAFNLLDQGSGYCKQLEQDIRNNKTFNGSIACYPPGRAGFNVSGQIQNGTEAQCLCRQFYMGQERLFAITRPGQPR